MPIQKHIFQTFKTHKLPWITQWHIWRLKKRNPDYTYHFFNDAEVDAFIEKEFSPEVFKLFKRIRIGAAKADFFRYAILYKKGGVYLDVDSAILTPLHEIISPSDSAVIALESNLQYYVQYALFFEAGHPFLKKTIDLVIQNLKENTYPFDPHKMTGPTAYTEAIRSVQQSQSNFSFRELDPDYSGKVRFSYRMSKLFLYGFGRKGHWKTETKLRSVLLPEA